MEREYYSYSIGLEGKIGFIIWYSSEKDGVFLSENGKIPFFSELESLLLIAKKYCIEVDINDPSFLNLEQLTTWLKSPSIDTIDCVLFLNAWNLFTDVSYSIGKNFETKSKLNNLIYDKLFWGNNLPSITPSGEFYIPKWSIREIDKIRKILTKGFTLFSQSVYYF